MMKIELKQVSVDQVIRFFRKGSILGGTVQSGSHGIEVQVDVESEAPKDAIARLVRVARESCFTHGALSAPVPVETHARLNGQPLPLD
jgi:hypothetical protein